MGDKEKVLAMYPKAVCKVWPIKNPLYVVAPSAEIPFEDLGFGDTEAEAWTHAADQLEHPVDEQLVVPEPTSGDVVPEDVKTWLEDRYENCISIAGGKQGEDRDGWLEDAEYFAAALTALATAERQRDEARETNRSLNRSKQALESAVAKQSQKGAFSDYFRIAAKLYGEQYDLRKELESQLTASQQSAESWRKRAEAMAAPVSQRLWCQFADETVASAPIKCAQIATAILAARLHAIEQPHGANGGGQNG